MKAKNFFLTALLAVALHPVNLVAAPSDPTPLITQSADALIDVLKSGGSRKAKADACRELAVIGTSRAVPALVSLLADEELSHMARYALETIPGAEVNQALRNELPRLQGRSLVGVIGSLGVRQDGKAVPPLTALLRNPDNEVAQAAARALGKIGTAEAARAIEKALAKTAPANRLAFHEGLFRCAETWAAGGKTKYAVALYDRLRRLPDVPHQIRTAALRGAILARGSNGLGLLKESLLSKDSALFCTAVRTALEMTNAEVTRVLTTCLPQLPAENQVVVLQALGARADVAALPALAAQTKTGPKPTRIAATRAVAAIGQAASVPVLLDLITASDSDVAQAALEGLAGVPGADADAAVLSLLKSSSAPTRLAGIDLVGRRRLVAAVPALVTAAADSDAKVRSSASQRLRKLGTPAEVPALLNLLLHPYSSNPSDLNGLGEALSSICTSADSKTTATEPIIAALSGAAPEPKAVLLGVLGAVGGENSLVAVRGALNDAQPEVRDAATSALAEWPDASAAPDLLQLVRAGANGNQRELAFRGYVRLVRDSTAAGTEKLTLLAEAGTMSANPTEQMLVLAGLGDIPSVAALRLVTPHLSDPALADAAGAAVVGIAEKLDAKDAEVLGLALNQVLKSAKSAPILDQARKQLDRLKLPVQ